MNEACGPSNLTLTPELLELARTAAERLPEAARCCERHIVAALLERGVRAILGEESPLSDRFVGLLTVRELRNALGAPDLEATKQHIARQRLAAKRAADEADLLLKDIGAVRSQGTISRLATEEQARDLAEKLVRARASSPALVLVIHSVWADATDGSYVPAPEVRSLRKEAN
jgi:hypothetical protein